MTWVVAASTIFGYGVLYSDVQVTFSDGTTKDLLRKAYAVGHSIAAGFAGSVKIGCMLIESLTANLETQDESGWDLVASAGRWAPTARRIFSSAETAERDLQSRLLLVGASPTEPSGLGAMVYFVRMTSPSFYPQVMRRPIKICGVGTGAGIAEYKRSIKPLFRLSSGILRAEVGRPGGWGNHLGHAISRLVGESPHHGISRHLHTIIVGRDGFMGGTTNQVDHHSDGTMTEHKMPIVAHSYVEFSHLARAAGYEAARAQC